MYPALHCEHERMSYIPFLLGSELVSLMMIKIGLKSITCIQDSYLTKERGSTVLAESGHYAFIIVTFNINASHNSLTQHITFSFQTLRI